MKDMNSHTKLVKHKRRKHSPDSQSDSCGSDNEGVPVINYTGDSESDNSSHDDPSRKTDKRSKKHKHHHHHHKRRHKEKELGRGRHTDIKDLQLVDESYTSRQAYASYRHRNDRFKVKEESNYSSHASRHRHPRDDSGERLRHHRKRDGESRHRREVTREKNPSVEHESTNHLNTHRERNGDSIERGRRRFKNGEHRVIPADRPIKQERISEEKDYQWGKPNSTNDNKNIPAGEKAKPNFGLSGKLAEETNTFNGVVLKYSEPPEARKPKRRWRFYPFKGDEGLPTLYLHRQSCYLIGRDRKVADIPVDHPSCSKQHAALQYRLVPYQRDDGSTGHRVRPYLIDLESANGTYVNNNKIEVKKYVELLEKDVIKFGYSSREYVLLHEQSKDDTMDDDVGGNE